MSKTEETSGTPALKLTYFPLAGRGEPIRFALHFGGIAFEDNRIKFPEWKTLKPTTPYGQLPLLEIDGVTHAQSGAMLRYAGRLGGSYPTEISEQLEVEKVLGLEADLDKAWTPLYQIANWPQALGYPSDFKNTDEGKAKIKEMREAFARDTIPKFYGYFTAQLKAHAAEDGTLQFMAGAKPTVADFAVVPSIEKYTLGFTDHVPTTVMDPYPELKEYIARVKALPGIREYLAALKK